MSNDESKKDSSLELNLSGESLNYILGVLLNSPGDEKESEVFSPHDKSNGGSDLDMVVGKEEREDLIKRNHFSEDSLDSMGYDLRLGKDVKLVTRRETVDMEEEGEIEVYPGETLSVVSLESLNLDEDVCAIGSPKMSLLTDGLWAHGGKTDFGYDDPLAFSFHHVGVEPVKLEYEQTIFHLTFFRVDNEKIKSYGGSGPPQWKTSDPSPLDGEGGNSSITEDFLKDVKEREGIKSYRLVKFFKNQFSGFRKKFMLMTIFSVIILFTALIPSIFPNKEWVIIDIIQIVFSLLLVVQGFIPGNKLNKVHKYLREFFEFF